MTNRYWNVMTLVSPGKKSLLLIIPIEVRQFAIRNAHHRQISRAVACRHGDGAP
jgi:hypothetical protein